VTLPERLLAIHASLSDAAVEHAFGGAIALAFWTLEPRGTRDIDVNVFTSQDECEQALAALPSGISYEDADVGRIKRDGQARLWWEDTPVDLFFSNLPIHDEAARHRRLVPFEGQMIPVLGPIELGVFKAMSDRTRDWADIEEMLGAGTLDADTLREHLGELAGDDDPRLARLDEALRRADRPEDATPR
jgi:Nucleotidyl transferase AbiEii toxin, Type IV TA system